MELTAQDRQDYQRVKRYVEQGDETFEPYLEWFLNGKKRNKAEKFPTQHKLAEILKDKYSNWSTGDLVRAFGEYDTFYYRLRIRQYSHVPAHKCRKILARIQSNT